MPIQEIVFGGPFVETRQRNGIEETVGVGGVIELLRDPEAFRGQIEWRKRQQERGAYEPLSTIRSHLDYLDAVSTDALIRVQDLWDNREALGRFALCGLPTSHGMGEGQLRQLRGTVLVAGSEFGRGSSREQAVWALKEAGIAAVIAPSFGPIFKSNAAYGRLHVSTNMDLVPKIERGESVPLSEFLKEYDPLHQSIIRAGGLFPYLRKLNNGTIPTPAVKTPANRPMNIYEQRVARSAGVPAVGPEDGLLLSPDAVFSYVGLSGLARIAHVEAYGTVLRRLDPWKILLFTDHFRYPSTTMPWIQDSTRNQRDFARELGLPAENYYDETRGGICHQEIKDRFDPRQTRVILGTDSHTSLSGSRPVLAIPGGSSLFAAAIAEGIIPYSVGRTLRVELTGALPEDVSIRDAQLLWAASYRSVIESLEQPSMPNVVEFGGDGLNRLTLEELEAMCNMGPEIFNADTAVTDVFATGIAHLVERWGMTEQEAIDLYGAPQPGCAYAHVERFDLSETVPSLALPGSPSNVVSLAALTGRPTIDLAFIGSCTNGYDALLEAAAVLEGRQISDRCQLIIVPSSPAIQACAEASGIVDILKKSGAIIEEVSACSLCIGNSPHAFKSGQVGFTASNRNFPGRMGDLSARVYMGSPLLTAMVAMDGTIPTLSEYRGEIGRIRENLKRLRG